MSATLERASASAGGKVILLGEHAVVHGAPAIAAGMDLSVGVTVEPARGGERRIVGGADARVSAAVEEGAHLVGIPVEAGFTVRIAGDLPVAVGLGSSAALCVALVRALAAARGGRLSRAEEGEHAHRLEGIFHGTPSGIDSTAAVVGGLIWFEAGPPPRHERLRPARSFDLVIVLSGSRHETGWTVAGLRERAAAAPEVYRPVFGAIGSLVSEARVAIERGDLERLGQLMTMNHGLLRACGVSTPALDAAVDTALAAGACGAKLTGGGGGGAAIALPGAGGEGLAASLREAGYDVRVTRIDGA